MSATPSREAPAADRLSDDILALIFMEWFKLYEEGYETIGYRFKPYSFIRIAHVCRRWRDVAIQYPLLWNRIVVTDRLEWMGIVLERSKGTPLTVRAGHQPHRALHACKLLRPVRHRVQSLTFTISPEIFPEILVHLNRPFPNLTSLILSNTDHEESTSPIMCFPLTFLNENWPKLRSLSLVLFGLSSITKQSSEIIDLRVHGPLNGPPVVIDFIALDSLPLLQTLHLEFVKLVPPKVAIDHERTIHLSNLRRLYVQDGIDELLAILTHLRFPPTSSIAVICHFDSFEEEKLQSLATGIFSRLNNTNRNSAPQTLVSLVVCINYNIDWIHIKGLLTDEVTFDSYRKDGHLTATFIPEDTDDWQLNGGSHGRFIRTFCSALPLQNIQTLSLDVFMIVEPATPNFITPQVLLELVPLFRQMTRLHRLAIHNTPLQDIKNFLLSSLSPPTDVDGDHEMDADARLIFPSLQHLILRKVSFDDPIPSAEPAQPPEDDVSSPVAILLNIFEVRKARSSPIRLLTLSQCPTISSASVPILEEVVELGDWPVGRADETDAPDMDLEDEP